VQVRCEQERSQAQNRLLARELLVGKIERRMRALRNQEQAQREKLRRQSRRPSRAAKERMLRDKAHHATKKRLRREPWND
jgi:protein subunit release factor B